MKFLNWVDIQILVPAFTIFAGADAIYDPSLDNKYRFYFWDPLFDASFDWENLTPAKLKSRNKSSEKILVHKGEPPVGWYRFEIELCESFFQLSKKSMARPESKIILEKFPSGLIPAKTLGDLLETSKISDLQLEDCEILACVRTDGDVIDAMKAATWTMHGPSWPSGSEQGVHKKLEKGSKLEPALRKKFAGLGAYLKNHLLMFAQTADSKVGAHFLGTESANRFKALQEMGFETIVAWRLNDQLTETAVFRLNPSKVQPDERPFIHRPKAVPATATFTDSHKLWKQAVWEDCPLDSEGRRQGLLKVWREDGSLLADWPMVHGKAQGLETVYHPDGTIYSEVQWKEGLVMEASVTRSEGPTDQPFPPKSHPDIWRIVHNSRDGILYCRQRFFDKQGQEISVQGGLLPPRPATVPEEAWYFSKTKQWFHTLYRQRDMQSLGLQRTWDADGNLTNEQIEIA